LKDFGSGVNQITNVSPLTGLTRFTNLNIYGNPDLIKAEIEKLQKALPKCRISHNATK
jgi:hypothetical protein